MNRGYGRWLVEDLHFEIIDTLSDHPIVTIRIRTPAGVLMVMGEPVMRGRVLVMRRTHLHGTRPNAVGVRNLRLIAGLVMEGMDVDGLIIEGALRTTGANPGRYPEPVRFARDAGAFAGRGFVCHTQH